MNTCKIGEMSWNLFSYIFLCSKYQNMNAVKQLTYHICYICTQYNRQSTRMLVSPAYIQYRLSPIYRKALIGQCCLYDYSKRDGHRHSKLWNQLNGVLFTLCTHQLMICHRHFTNVPLIYMYMPLCTNNKILTYIPKYYHVLQIDRVSIWNCGQ